jgi:putative DNA primase/helicase
MAESRTTWVPIIPVPADAPARPVAHRNRGKPEAEYAYYVEAGIAGYRWRFTDSQGEAVWLPLTYCVNEGSMACEWRHVQLPEPRPIYGADNLKLKPGSPILLFDDEACVRAASQALAGYTAVSWAGYLDGAKKTDWRPLSGRQVVIWTTALDETSGSGSGYLPRMKQGCMKAAMAVAERLVRLTCDVRFVNLPPSGELEHGFNLSKAIAKGWNVADIQTFIQDHLKTWFSKGNLGFQDTPTPTKARASTDDEWRKSLIWKKGEIADCRENVAYILTHHEDWKDVLAFNSFSYKVEKRKPPPWQGGALGAWEESDHISLGMWLARNEGLLVRPIENLARGIAFAAAQRKFHPVVDWLRSLEWDGKERLDHWLGDCLGAREGEYSALAGRYFLMNMVARVFEPGCIMRSVLVLIGEQNRGKSEALRILAEPWFADTTFIVGEKDAYQVLRGKWLYEIAEFHSFGKAEATKVKAFVSSRTDTYRASYGQEARDWDRQICFAASTNHYEIFTDPTGNTRFWPVDVSSDLNLQLLREWRPQLFAEAVKRYLAGDRRYPTPEEELQLFQPEQELHEIVDAWLVDLEEFLQKVGMSRDWVSMNEILYDCFGFEKSKLTPAMGEQKRIASLLQRLGWKKGQRRIDGKRPHVYVRPAVRIADAKAEVAGKSDESIRL